MALFAEVAGVADRLAREASRLKKRAAIAEAVSILASPKSQEVLTDAGRFCLVEEYRYPVRRRAWAFPQGGWPGAMRPPRAAISMSCDRCRSHSAVTVDCPFCREISGAPSSRPRP